MVVVQINLSCTWGSTGKICDSVSKLLTENGIENYIFYTYGNNPQNCYNYIRYGNRVYEKIQALKSRILGNYGFNSYLATHWLINRLEEIKPDIVHIHNIHSHDCHFEKLFRYLKKRISRFFIHSMIAGLLRDIVRISPWRSVNDGLKVAGIVLLENGTAGFLIEVRRTYKKR